MHALTQANFSFYIFGVYFSITSSDAESFSQKSARNLEMVYEAALARSETVGVQNELLRQADELEAQAKGAIFPTVSGSAILLKQASVRNAIGGQLYPSNQKTVVFSASMPLFRGFRDFAALKQRKLVSSAQRSAIASASRQLFYDVATAFYNLLSLNQEVANYEAEIRISSERLQELQRFLRLGRSQPSEVLSVKANVSSLEAQLESVRTQLEIAKDVLAFLTGWGREVKLRDDESLFDVKEDLSAYLSRIEERPEVKQAALSLQAAEEGVPIARGGHLPSVDLSSQYFIERPGALEDSNWNIQLSLTLPIFQGGVIQSQVRQAVSVVQQNELVLSQARRAAEEEIRTFYVALKGGKVQMEKSTEAAQVSRESYQATLHDYRNGVVRNIDLLQAITTFRDPQRALDQQRYLVKLASAKFEAAIDRRPGPSAQGKEP